MKYFYRSERKGMGWMEEFFFSLAQNRLHDFLRGGIAKTIEETLFWVASLASDFPFFRLARVLSSVPFSKIRP